MSAHKTGCIIQARMTSSRLPGKVLLPLPGTRSLPVLEAVIDRVRKSALIDTVIIATTVNSTDDPLVERCDALGIPAFRGSEDHVLSRYAECALEHKLDHIVRVTSDCPCVDWEILDTLISLHLREKNDYTSNTLTRSFPHGVDAEVFTANTLSEAMAQATEKYEVEHVTPYIYKSHPERFQIGELIADESLYAPHIRITLDTREDYLLLRAVYDLLGDHHTFSTADVVRLFSKHPWLGEINSHVQQKALCSSLEEEIEEGLRLLRRQDLNRAANYLEGLPH